MLRACWGPDRAHNAVSASSHGKDFERVINLSWPNFPRWETGCVSDILLV